MGHHLSGSVAFVLLFDWGSRSQFGGDGGSSSTVMSSWGLGNCENCQILKERKANKKTNSPNKQKAAELDSFLLTPCCPQIWISAA